MLTVMSVLKSGGDFDATWVDKLKNAVARNLTIPHRFVCLSDVEVPCARIHIGVDWPGWWPKLLLFMPGVISGPTVYFDLDTVITDNIDGLAKLSSNFALLRSFFQPSMVGSGMMWFSGRNVPTEIYTKFAKMPEAYMAHHERNRQGTYVGDQGFIYDVLGADVPKLQDEFDGIRSYKYHCVNRLVPGTKIVCFAGHPRPNEVDDKWVKEAWA